MTEQIQKEQLALVNELNRILDLMDILGLDEFKKQSDIVKDKMKRLKESPARYFEEFKTH